MHTLNPRGIPELWTGDLPAGTFALEVIDDHGMIGKLSPGVTITAELVEPRSVGGARVVAAQVPVTRHDADEGTALVLTWPGVALDRAGVWAVRVRLDGIRMPDASFPVQEETGWLSLSEARTMGWPDAPLNDATLYQLLEASKSQCIEYAPPLKTDALIPDAWRQAQIMQARSTWASAQADQSDQLGPDGLVIRIHSMSTDVQKLLRPPTPRMVIR
ncbi:hypothetical protein [Mycetocola saprophilus]|uniref:hypothetical protein n=1 Tax=Mycetocola saprophilus TaxID=76636 RepID=UPI003BEFC2CD